MGYVKYVLYTVLDTYKWCMVVECMLKCYITTFSCANMLKILGIAKLMREYIVKYVNIVSASGM